MKALFNQALKGWSGRIGDLIYRQMPDGSTVVNCAPDHEDLKFSENQIAHQKKFGKATAYAVQAAREFPIYAELAAASTMRTAYNFALSDWWHAPVIHHIER